MINIFKYQFPIMTFALKLLYYVITCTEVVFAWYESFVSIIIALRDLLDL